MFFLFFLFISPKTTRANIKHVLILYKLLYMVFLKKFFLGSLSKTCRNPTTHTNAQLIIRHSANFLSGQTLHFHYL